MFQALLAAIKPAVSQEFVIEYAVALAEELGLQVEGASVIDLSRLAPPEATPIGATSFKIDRDQKIIAKAREVSVEHMTRLFELCGNRKVSCDAHLYEGDTLTIITEATQRVDLLICGHVPGGDIGEQSLLQSLLRKVSRPAVIVPQGAFGNRTALVAYDGSPEAVRAMAAFVDSGLANRRKIHLVSYGKDFKQTCKVADNAAKFLERHQITATIMTGEIARHLAEQLFTAAAEVSADLLVMGSFGTNALQEFFLGSVTRSVLDSLPIPIFLHH